MNTSSFLRSFAALTALAVGAALLPSSAQAQQMQAQQTESQQLTSGPRVATAGISNVVQAESGSGESFSMQDSMGNGRNIAMMVVGGAAIVVGGIVGGDGGQIIMISGAVIGLVGLFQYLR